MRRFHRGEEGQAIVMIAITFLGMLMAVGLAIDAGQLFVARRTMQEAADAGAYAGAVVNYQRTLLGAAVDENLAHLAAVNDTSLNGYTDDTALGGTTIVTIRRPIDTPWNTSSYVEVIIQAQVRTALVPAQSTLTTVRVSAIAGSEPLNNGYAIIALSRNAPNAFTLSPNADVNLTGGGIMINSSCTPSVSAAPCSGGSAGASAQNNLSRFIIQSPHGVDVAGSVTSPANWPATGAGLQTGQPQIADPFAGFPTPLLPACATPPNTACVFNSLPGGNGDLIQPGVYTTEISDRKLAAGTYILKAGMGGDVFSDPGVEVFLFNTTMNYPNNKPPNAPGSCAGIVVSGNHPDSLRASTVVGDPYKGMLIYQDPLCATAMRINGSATFSATGSVYLPNAAFQFNGNPSTLSSGQLIAKTIDIQNGNLTINFSAANSAQPILPRLTR